MLKTGPKLGKWAYWNEHMYFKKLKAFMYTIHIWTDYVNNFSPISIC